MAEEEVFIQVSAVMVVLEIPRSAAPQLMKVVAPLNLMVLPEPGKDWAITTAGSTINAITRSADL